MSNDLNRCDFIGRLGADPETKYTATGAAIANFRIAVGKKWRDKQTGESKESTQWVRIVAFGKLAEIMGEYLVKGSRVFVSGEFRERKWQDQNGQDRYTTEIVASQMQMLDSKQTADKPQGFRQPIANDIADRVVTRDYPADGHADQQHQAQFDDFADDDLPF